MFMTKVFTLIAACALTAGSAYAQQHSAMNFVGSADFYIATMKNQTYTNINKDTVKVTLGTGNASFALPKMVYQAMNVTVAPFTLSDLTYKMTGSFQTGDMAFTWANDGDIKTTTTDATGTEKEVTVTSFSATYTHTTGELTLAMTFKYGSMPFAITYETKGYYTIDNAWKLVGRGTSGNPYKIYDASDFTAMATNISANNTGAGEYFVMMNNVNFGGSADSPVQLPAIGKAAIQSITKIDYSFQGTFDAQNDTISGIYHTNCGNDTNGKFNALFSSVGDKGSIKNLVISKDNYIKSYNYVAPIVSVLAGTVEGCENYADVTATNFAASGIAGCVASAAKITDCNNKGNITANTYASGICGGSVLGNITADSYPYIYNCSNTGNISSTNGIGSAGIAGSFAGKVEKCINSGTIDDTNTNNEKGQYTGGIVACGSKVTYVSDCTNQGEVKGLKNVGGIVGIVMNETGKVNAAITGCTNDGAVSGKTTNVAGIVGNTAYKTYKVNISSCTNNAAVTTEQEDKSTIGNLRGSSAIVLGDGNTIANGLTLYNLDPTTTGISNVNAAEDAEATAKTVKYFKDGQLVIKKNGKTYSVAGTEL